jgi:small subunit ribosomal protein S6
VFASFDNTVPTHFQVMEGFYIIYEYKAPAEFVAKFELAFRRDERIMRFLTTSLDKHAQVYNQRKRNGEFNQNKKEKQQEGK